MKQIKVEVGKTYRSREGKEVKIVDFCKELPYHPYKGNEGKWYRADGMWANRKSPYDLIEEVKEVPETRHTFTIPEGVKELTVEQVGNRIVVEMVPEDVKTPKAGDVMVNTGGSVYIFKAVADSDGHKYYAWLAKSDNLDIGASCSSCYPGRPATPEEAQPLFDALKKAGKRWNPETMQVEDVPEIERIREWVWANLEADLYAKGDVAEAIEGYLKHKEGKK